METAREADREMDAFGRMLKDPLERLATETQRKDGHPNYFDMDTPLTRVPDSPLCAWPRLWSYDSDLDLDNPADTVHASTHLILDQQVCETVAGEYDFRFLAPSFNSRELWVDLPVDNVPSSLHLKKCTLVIAESLYYFIGEEIPNPPVTDVRRSWKMEIVFQNDDEYLLEIEVPSNANRFRFEIYRKGDGCRSGESSHHHMDGQFARIIRAILLLSGPPYPKFKLSTWSDVLKDILREHGCESIGLMRS